MTLFEVICQVKQDQWLILSTCINYTFFPCFPIFLNANQRKPFFPLVWILCSLSGESLEPESQRANEPMGSLWIDSRPPPRPLVVSKWIGVWRPMQNLFLCLYFCCVKMTLLTMRKDDQDREKLSTKIPLGCYNSSSKVSHLLPI